MLNGQGFDLWAEDYDKSVGLSDESDTYPFAGYKCILNKIYQTICIRSEKTVLDLGFGTGVLTSKLYTHGCDIYGQDFSGRMLALAQAKMPKAKLYQGDFSLGLIEALERKQYDAIVATYSLHHLTDAKKLEFLKHLLLLLNEGGHIYIGDIAFQTRAELNKCREQAGDEWDSDEIYFVFDELKEMFPDIKFEQVSFCAGLFSLER